VTVEQWAMRNLEEDGMSSQTAANAIRKAKSLWCGKAMKQLWSIDIEGYPATLLSEMLQELKYIARKIQTEN